MQKSRRFPVVSECFLKSSALVVGLLADEVDDVLHPGDHGVDVLLEVVPLAGDPEAAHVVGEPLGNEDLPGVEGPQNLAVDFTSL